MKQNTIRIPVRFNLNNPEHAEIVSILKNLNKNFHTTQNSFMIDALKFYIRNMSEDVLTADGAERKKRSSDYATYEYVDTNIKELKQSLKLFVYERIEAANAARPVRDISYETTQSEVTEQPDREVDLSKYDTIMNDIDQWTN